ncbi:unnamed protein product [marine sediment metagenome]|uniref:Uncharacterized protein n=1 Tax=marine sediment metagenome TaxID=412755 RepID=X0YKI6_9ZZZZ
MLNVTAVIGPGAMTPDKDIKTASNKKADNNNFYSFVERNRSLEKNYYFFIILDLFIYCISSTQSIDLIAKKVKERVDGKIFVEIINNKSIIIL